MGNSTFMREEARGVWIWPWLDRLVQDVRYSARSARKSPAFSLGVIAITALGIGATTTIFSVVDGVIVRGLPYPAAERLVYFDMGAHSPPRLRDWQREISSVELWAAAWADDYDLVGEGKPQRLSGAMVSPDFFLVFGGRPVRGRVFGPGDYAGAGEVAAISGRLWRQRFGADESVLGKTVEVNGRRVVVVGVIADDFVEPEEVTRRPTDVWLPLVLPPELANSTNLQALNVAGRLRPGVTVDAARRELAVVAPRLHQANREAHSDYEDRAFTIPIVPLQQAIVGDVERALTTLLTAVGLMLLIACANVTNLYLARSTDRAREMAVRTALGAGRSRLARLLVTESVTLGLVAGGVGSGLAFAGVRLLLKLYPGEFPRAADVTVDGRVLAFALVVSILTGVGFGLVPTWGLGERKTHQAIKAGGLVEGGHRRRLRGGLVVSEVALALVLLVGSGLLFHSFLRIIRVDPGFDPAGLAMVRLRFGDQYSTERRQAIGRDLIERIEAVPGVAEVAIGVSGPMSMTGQGRCCWGASRVIIDGGTEVETRVMLHPVSPRYFAVIGARIEGASFGDDETFAAPYPAVISSELARKLFAERDPIGQKLSVGDDEFQVRGVVSGLHQWGLDQASERELFVPFAVFGGRNSRLNAIVRTAGPPAPVLSALRQAVAQVEPTLPADDVATMDQLIRASLAGPRFYSTLMGGFAGLALILAAGGVYASMLYSVRQRLRELGIRVALGAKSRDITRLVVGDAGRLAAVGLILGSLGAIALGRALGAFLFGIGPSDPVTFGLAAGVLGATVLAAAYLPARRASGADPVAVLRAD
jgi:predicted permease